MNVGLVVGGGMAKGAFEIGALEALGEYLSLEDVKVYSTASIGALNAYAFATGNLQKAKQMWIDACSEKKTLLTSVFKNNKIDGFIRELVVDEVPQADFYFPLCNIKRRIFSYVLLNRLNYEERCLYLRGAIAYPILSKPVCINGINYYDGALVDNIPVKPLVGRELDYIVCMYFDRYHYVFEDSCFDEKIIKITFDDTLLKSVVISRNETERMIRKGYETAKAIFSLVFSDGVEDVPAVYGKIKSLNALHKEGEIRLTGDVVFNNMTRIIRKYGVRRIDL
ncbi:MAG: patatin-like phospholipase family protein [Christensenellaceae bacterium]